MTVKIREDWRKWKQEKTLRMLGQGKVTLSRAAHMAGMDLFSFAGLVKSFTVALVGIRYDELRKDLKSLRRNSCRD